MAVGLVKVLESSPLISRGIRDKKEDEGRERNVDYLNLE